jgi:hypothetical protein
VERIKSNIREDLLHNQQDVPIQIASQANQEIEVEKSLSLLDIEQFHLPRFVTIHIAVGGSKMAQKIETHHQLLRRQ